MAQRARLDIRQTGKQLGLLFVLVALANVAVWFGLTRPVKGHYRDLLAASGDHDRVAERRDEVSDREQFLEALGKADEDLAYLQEVLSTREERMVPVQAEIERIAGDFNINIDSVTYGHDIELDGGVDRMTVDVPLEGGYGSLRRFLQAIEQSPAFLVVERVALAKGQQGGTTLQLNITLATYFNVPEDMLKRKDEAERRSRRRKSA